MSTRKLRSLATKAVSAGRDIVETITATTVTVESNGGAGKPTAKKSPKSTVPDASAERPKFKHGTLPKTFEEARYKAGFSHVCGVDEAGRGPLAGPVVAAACIVPKSVYIEGIHDSKKLNEGEREALFELLTGNPDVLYGVAIVDHKEIDEINILQASMRAMERAVASLSAKVKPDCVIVDGPHVPAQLKELYGDAVSPLVKGDSKCYSIAAASVIAKVTRDRFMVELAGKYPEYGLEQHKGYPTASHVAAIRKHGPSPIHRRTFAPLKVWFPLPTPVETATQETAVTVTKRTTKDADKSTSTSKRRKRT